MQAAEFILALGVLFLLALVLDAVGRRIHVPRVTLLMLLGTVLGPPVLDVLPPPLAGADKGYSAVALSMVAFLLGGTLVKSTLAAHGREILVMSLSVVVISIALVAGTLLLAGAPMVVALALAGISAATAPAATRDVVLQSGNRGRFARNLLGIVAVDDVWGLLAFSLLLTVAGMLSAGVAVDGAQGAIASGGALPAAALHTTSGALGHGLREAGGGILLGVVVGVPAAYLTGRIKPGEPSLLEALGIVLICSGAALHLGVSYLLAGIVAGAIVVNLAKHHSYPFHEIERIEWPFVLLFFIMAGASLDIGLLATFGFIGALYVAARMAARVAGGMLGAHLSGLPPREGVYTGLSLAPQAGVALGMALVTGERFPEHAAQILAITVASTIVFEVVGPVLTLLSLARMGDTDPDDESRGGPGDR